MQALNEIFSVSWTFKKMMKFYHRIGFDSIVCQSWQYFYSIVYRKIRNDTLYSVIYRIVWQLQHQKKSTLQGLNPQLSNQKKAPRLKAPRRDWIRNYPITDGEPARSTIDVFDLSKWINGIY